MKKTLFNIIAAVSLLALAAATARAQSASTLRVNVPFEFGAAEKTLPAGEYSVRVVSDNGLLLRSADGRTKVVVQAPLARENKGHAAGARLVFRRYGDAYFLAQVWGSRGDSGRELYASNAEAGAAKRLRIAGAPKAAPQTVEVAAARE
jgi:hypothetical protein